MLTALPEVQQISHSAFYFRRCIYIGHDRHPRIPLAQRANVRCSNRIGQRTAGAEVRDKHGLAGVQQLGGLGHEVNACQYDNVGIGIHCTLRQGERITRYIGDAVENLRCLVVVCEDNGILFLLQLIDRRNVRGMHRPFDLRYDGTDALIERRHLVQRGFIDRIDVHEAPACLMLRKSIYYAHSEHIDQAPTKVAFWPVQTKQQ